MGFFNYFTSISLLLYQVAAKSAPTAETPNGTYSGLYSQSFNQDLFLGIPYLQAPVGNRRFHPADSLTDTWNGTVAATSYAPSCVGYDTSVDASEMSEDCLYLNVIRSHAVSVSAKLPIVVFLHGGGFSGGSASESRYNLSYIVDRSTELSQPILAVSFNYRLSAWGFIYSNEVRDTGATNIGLRDQRFALALIQEKVAGFGGDPAKVTLWGQDSGAFSIGFQITAYEGRNDSLLRAAIMESGNPTPMQGLNGTQYYHPINTCFDATDRMNCLRSASFSDINEAINSTSLRGWFPVIDGNIVTHQASRSLFTKKYLSVPIILGANTDEGSFYMPNSNITTDAEFVDLIASMFSLHLFLLLSAC
ncbi:uncharacterized protein ASPGLDRAFT_124931 [Aspergillus glaucus CBS 516.65]|uniref:Carboxylesterase type B domain-containing protein n=1 Tax=Aspergillus glaucus CBS 516.65 TaxID=1160497 RepID=A0A1L9VN29_ASPGL|nr:hypothetical protein ASPGLDRAFT_124931 [Aspergillus glaucus CBS 516.65]OJJ85280.1 hypothetical protein ASPGLDRAFT_124931 [Aspergillus glaucus CBS 516.65]